MRKNEVIEKKWERRNRLRKEREREKMTEKKKERRKWQRKWIGVEKKKEKDESNWKKEPEGRKW